MSHKKAETQPPQIAVVGFGNILLKDEGIGVHVIQNMEAAFGKGVRECLLIDGGTAPDVLYHLPKEIRTLIVVDAVQGGGEPGTIYRFTPDDMAYRAVSTVTLHQLGLRDGLGMMKRLDQYPERIIIWGIEPKEIDWGLQISPELEQVVHRVANLVKREIDGQAGPDRGPADEETPFPA